MKLSRLLSVLLCLTLFASGCTNMPQNADILLSEVVSVNSCCYADPVYGSADWVELFNPTALPVDLTGYVLSCGDSHYSFGGVTVPAGGYQLVICSDESLEGSVLPCTGFLLPDGEFTLTLSNQKKKIDSVKVPQLEADISYGRNLNGKWRYYQPTPGSVQTGTGYDSVSAFVSSSGLRINEVLPYGTDEVDGCHCSWVEVYNGTSAPVNLQDYFLSDDASTPLKYHLPAITVNTGGYALLPLQGASPARANELSFTISRSVSQLLLSSRDSTLVSTLSWSTGILSCLSVGIDSRGKLSYFTEHTPGKANTASSITNASLQEKISSVIINEYLLQNTFSLVSQNGKRYAWVELWNQSNQEVSLTGYYLSDSVADPCKWRLPASSLAPGASTVVFLSGRDQTSGELDTSFEISPKNNVLLLINVAALTKQTVQLDQALAQNNSCGLAASGTWVYFAAPTPGSPNTTKSFPDGATAGKQPLSGLFISEVSAVQSKPSSLFDWVELYNSSDSPMDLNGYYLSDKKSALKQVPLSGTVPAGGYLTIGRNKELFSLAFDGETVYLTNSAGYLIDTLEYPLLRVNLSAGRDFSKGAGVLLFQAQTPGQANNAATFAGYCTPPVLSLSGGYYQSTSVTVTLCCPSSDAQIHYTTDGSTPTAASKVYTTPLTFSVTTPLRAIAVRNGYVNSAEAAATYRLGIDKHTLPVVCLSMTQSDLDYVFGSKDRYDPREAGGFVEYDKADGTVGTTFPAGFSIGGNSSRTYPQKTINLHLRGCYGQTSVTYPFFENYQLTTFTSLTLRNSGQDTSSTKLRDAFTSMAVNGMHIDNAQTNFVVVYVNGKFWGLYECKENQNEDYFAARYGADPDQVQLVRSNTTVYNKVGTNKNIKELFALAKKDTSNDAIYEEYLNYVDEEYFTDYLIIVSFFCADDMYNQKTAYAMDGTFKWRPILYDLDYTLYAPSGKTLSAYLITDGYTTPGGFQVDTSLYHAFYKNAAWREKFVERYAQVLNTILTNDRLLELYTEMYDAVAPEIPRAIDRWHTPASFNNWNSHCKDLKSCISARREYCIKELQTTFHLSDERIVQLFPNG